MSSTLQLPNPGAFGLDPSNRPAKAWQTVFPQKINYKPAGTQKLRPREGCWLCSLLLGHYSGIYVLGLFYIFTAGVGRKESDTQTQS